MLNHPLSGFSENKIISFQLFEVLTKIQGGVVLEMHNSVGGMKIFLVPKYKGHCSPTTDEIPSVIHIWPSDSQVSCLMLSVGSDSICLPLCGHEYISTHTPCIPQLITALPGFRIQMNGANKALQRVPNILTIPSNYVHLIYLLVKITWRRCIFESVSFSLSYGNLTLKGHFHCSWKRWGWMEQKQRGFIESSFLTEVMNSPTIA